MKERKAIAELKKEIELLKKWIRNTESGGWSTQNLDEMKTRLADLKAVVYDLEFSL